MILPIFVLVLFAALAQSSEEGASCSLTNGTPGVCTPALNCRSVLEQLVTGNYVPDKVCGFSIADNTPVVCCPLNVTTPANSADEGRGAIARQKCAEYSQSVFVLKQLATSGDKLQPQNVSQCVIKNSQPLIEPSSRAEPGEFPHMAAVGFDLENGDIGWYCGGTLISENFVLSAAHCTFSINLGNATWVRVGDVNLMESVNDGARPEVRRIVERIRHPEYKPPAQYHDIALLRLESRVPFNRWIRPACLHTEPTTGGQKAIATGWHSSDWVDAEDQTQLMKTTLSIVDSKTCEATWTPSGKDIKLPNGLVNDWSICASTNDRDDCQGDTGGPLVIYSKPEYHCMYDVIGVSSLLKLCGIMFPSIYTRVYNYVPWIESTVWGTG